MCLDSDGKTIKLNLLITGTAGAAPTLDDAAKDLTNPGRGAIQGSLLTTGASTASLKKLLSADPPLHAKNGLDATTAQQVRIALTEASQALALGDKNAAALIARVANDVVHVSISSFASGGSIPKPDSTLTELATFAIARLGQYAGPKHPEALDCLVALSRTNSPTSAIGASALEQILSLSSRFSTYSQFAEVIKSLGKDRLAEAFSQQNPSNPNLPITRYPVIEGLAKPEMGFCRVELFRNLLTDPEALYSGYYPILAKALMPGILSHAGMSRDQVVEALTHVAQNGATRDVRVMAVEALAAPNILARRELLGILHHNYDLRILAMRCLAKAQSACASLWNDRTGGNPVLYDEIVSTLRDFRREAFGNTAFVAEANSALKVIQRSGIEAFSTRLTDWGSTVAATFKIFFQSFHGGGTLEHKNSN